MPLNFDQIVTAVQRRVADHALATDTVVGNLVNEAHAELLESDEWSRKKDEIITVGGDRRVTVAGNEVLITDGNRTVTVGIDDTLTVDGNRTVTVGVDEVLITSGNRTATVDGNETLTVGGAVNITVTGDCDLKAANVSIDAATTNLGVGGAPIARVGDAVTVNVIGGSSAGPHSGTITGGGVNTSI